MFYCNKCDQSFTRKDNLIRHHRRFHNDEASFKLLLKSLGKDMQQAQSSKEMSNEELESQSDTDEEMDEDSIASTSSSDDDDDIEDDLNDEDASTPSLYPLRNVWAMLDDDANSCYDGDVVDAYIDQVRIGRQLKSDPVSNRNNAESATTRS